jgi:hypothetical protein
MESVTSPWDMDSLDGHERRMPGPDAAASDTVAASSPGGSSRSTAQASYDEHGRAHLLSLPGVMIRGGDADAAAPGGKKKRRLPKLKIFRKDKKDDGGSEAPRMTE